jgi:hypothetical protein
VRRIQKPVYIFFCSRLFVGALKDAKKQFPLWPPIVIWVHLLALLHNTNTFFLIGASHSLSFYLFYGSSGWQPESCTFSLWFIQVMHLYNVIAARGAFHERKVAGLFKNYNILCIRCLFKIWRSCEAAAILLS